MITETPSVPKVYEKPCFSYHLSNCRVRALQIGHCGHSTKPARAHEAFGQCSQKYGLILGWFCESGSRTQWSMWVPFHLRTFYDSVILRYVDNYQNKDYKIEQLLKIANHILFSPLNLSNHLFCTDNINMASYINLHQMPLQFGRESCSLPDKTFDLAIRHEPIFLNILIYISLSVSRSETGVGNWLKEGQVTMQRHANSGCWKAGRSKQ